jgi:hypothetical protein
VADFFFVSSKVAKTYPALLESSLILSYRSHIPPDGLRDKWHKHGSRDTKMQIVGLVTYLSRAASFFISLAAVEMFGRIPLEFQRMLIRFIQPMMLSGAVLFCFKTKDKFGLLYSALLIFGPLSGIVILVWISVKHCTNKESSANSDPVAISPILSVMPVVEPTTEKYDMKFIENVSNNEGKLNTDDGNPVICQNISISRSSNSSKSSYSYAFSDSTICNEATVVNVDAPLSENISEDIDLSSIDISAESSDSDSLSSISDETNDKPEK